MIYSVKSFWKVNEYPCTIIVVINWFSYFITNIHKSHICRAFFLNPYWLELNDWLYSKTTLILNNEALEPQTSRSVRRRSFYLPHPHFWHPSWGLPKSNGISAQSLTWESYSPCAIVQGCLRNDMFSCFDRTRICDRKRQTQGKITYC